MVRQTIINVDAHTGEVMPGALVFMPAKRQNGFGKGWSAMAHGGWMVLAKSGLSGEALRVHAVVMGTIGWANVVTVTQAEIARQLGITPQAVNRSWRALLGADLVRRLKRTDEHGIERELWIASPYVSWRGDSRKHALAMREWDAVQERSS